MLEKESRYVQAKSLKLHSLLLLLILSATSMAAEDKRLGFNTSLTALSNLAKRSDFRHTSSSIFSIGANYSLNGKHSLSAGFQGVKNLSGDYETSDEVIFLSHSHKLGTYRNFDFVTGQSVFIPLNSAARVDQTLRGNFSASIAASRSLKLFVPFSFTLGLTGTKNFHKFCLLYTSPSPRDQRGSRMPSSA